MVDEVNFVASEMVKRVQQRSVVWERVEVFIKNVVAEEYERQ